MKSVVTIVEKSSFYTLFIYPWVYWKA